LQLNRSQRLVNDGETSGHCFNMKKSKLRNTLAKEIKKVAQRGDFLSTSDAQEIAQYGRRLTPTESAFRIYYAYRATLKHAVDGTWSDPREWIMHEPDGKERAMTWREVQEFGLKWVGDGLREQFMAAVDADDFQKIYELAEAVRFFKTNKYPVHCDADPERAALLSLKKQFRHEDKDEDKMTIREVAEYLAWEKTFKIGDSVKSNFPKVETPADGFSALRRKCREMDFPLAPSKRKPARPVKSK
jgi:hypothetical protein